MAFTFKPPKFGIGDKEGNLTVTEIQGREHRGLVKGHWWYTVECSCGEVITLNQGQLVRRIDCDICQKDRKARSLISVKRKPKPPADVPDFARIPLRAGQGRTG